MSHNVALLLPPTAGPDSVSQRAIYSSNSREHRHEALGGPSSRVFRSGDGVFTIHSPWLDREKKIAHGPHALPSYFFVIVASRCPRTR